MMLRRPREPPAAPRQATSSAAVDVGTRLFSNMAPFPQREAVAPPPPRTEPHPLAASVDGTIRPWGPEWEAREARLPPEEGQQEGAPLRTPLGEPIRKLVGSPVFAHVHPSIGVAAAAGDKGLGLFAAEDLAPDSLVCMYTGVWCYESEMEAQFPRDVELNLACVHNYSFASHYAFTQAEADRSRRTRQPHIGQPSHTGGGANKVRMQRLVCCPRMSVDSGGPTAFSVGLCNLQYSDAPGAPLCDAAALINNSHPMPGNCRVYEAVCTPADAEFTGDDAGTRVEHACLVVRTGPEPIPAGTELEFDYTYSSTKKTDPRRTGAGYTFPLEGRRFNDSSRDGRSREMNIAYSELAFERELGARVAAELAAMVPPRPLTTAMCGPSVWFFDAGSALKPNAVCMVSSLPMQPNLRPLILESDA